MKMRIWIRKGAVALVLIGLTYTFGPLVTAVVDGLTLPADERYRNDSLSLLLESYDRRHWKLTTTVRIHERGQECGYDPHVLFGADLENMNIETHGSGWNPFQGHFDLKAWQASQWHQTNEALRLRYLEKSLTPFSATFLHECIEASVFRSICDRRLGRILDEFEWPHEGSELEQFATADDQVRQKKTICTYLDGVAARRGLPLGTPTDPQLRRTFSGDRSPEGRNAARERGAG